MKRAFCKFHEQCRFSDEVAHPGREKAAIRRGRAGLFSYCVLLSENPEEQLDILHSAFLKSARYKSHPPVIYGVAKSKNGAIDLVASLFAEAARAGFPGNARAYLETL